MGIDYVSDAPKKTDVKVEKNDMSEALFLRGLNVPCPSYILNLSSLILSFINVIINACKIMDIGKRGPNFNWHSIASKNHASPGSLLTFPHTHICMCICQVIVQ